VAVRAQEAQILDAVVIPDAVDVVQLKDQGLPAPLGDSATRALIWPEASRHNTPLEAHAIRVCAALDKDF